MLKPKLFSLSLCQEWKNFPCNVHQLQGGPPHGLGLEHHQHILCYYLWCDPVLPAVHCQTSKTMREIFTQHCGYVNNNVEATGKHFNLPGHSKSYMNIKVVEQIHSKDTWVREQFLSLPSPVCFFF